MQGAHDAAMGPRGIAYSTSISMFIPLVLRDIIFGFLSSITHAVVLSFLIKFSKMILHLSLLSY